MTFARTLSRAARHRVIVPMVAALARALSVLPTRALLRVGTIFAEAAWHMSPRARSVTLANLGQAFPQASEAERIGVGRAAYRHLGEILADLIAALTKRRVLPEITLTDDAHRTLTRALAQRRGVVLVSAHLGPWERVAHAITEAGFPLTAVTRAPPYPAFAKALGVIRTQLATIDRDRPGAAFGMLKTLRAGRILGIPMDLATRSASVMADFFEKPAPTASGPARFALRTGAAVVAATAARNRVTGEIRVTCTYIDTTHIRDPQHLTSAINRELCARIRAYPEGWMWMHRRFRRAV